MKVVIEVKVPVEQAGGDCHDVMVDVMTLENLLKFFNHFKVNGGDIKVIKVTRGQKGESKTFLHPLQQVKVPKYRLRMIVFSSLPNSSVLWRHHIPSSMELLFSNFY